MPNTAEFRRVLRTAFAGAQLLSLDHLIVNARDLHELVGNYPGPNSRMSACCDVMHQEYREGDTILEGTPKGKGARLTIRYQLPRP